MMLQALAVGGAGIAGVRVADAAEPAPPGPGEALVRLTAATLNYRDLIVARGQMPGLAKEPAVVPLSCGAGEVTAVGAGVERVAVGDRVSPIFALSWIEGGQMVPTMGMLGGSADGTARQHAVFPADSLVLLPDTLGDLEAATLPCAGLTAWNALFQHRPVQPGEWVLCPGTGGVSVAALQFAHAAGAKVVVTSSSDAKLRRAAALGADVTINYRSDPDWPEAVRRATGGVAVVVDVVGASQLAAHVSLVAPGGAIAAIGMLGSDFSWHEAEAGGAPIHRITVGNRTQHEAMLAFCADHGVRPVVDVVYDLARLRDAYRRLESGAFFGKVGINLR